MQPANLNKENIAVNDGVDTIVITKDVADIPGGRTLDVSGVASDVTTIRAGHVIIKDDAKNTYKPLNVTGGAYAELPSGHSYVGILKASILKKDPRAAILTMGQVNAAACPFAITVAIKTALPQINFIY